MDVNKFTETELKLILHCVNVTLDWGLKNPDPQFYEDLDSITQKCTRAISQPVADVKADVEKGNIQRAAKKHESNVTTNLGSILANLSLPN
ncbi:MULTISPECIES: hypothetical protein [Lachnospiraceae]|uniref:hypothetical protein n=1 Tax=Lachnospiraceae TaxID=186803 RepID=UPI000E42DD4A|nr:hypothetical protein [Hungatella hathewayi]RGO65920.1 hypothetical protein DXB08_28760 [Hungatella hathewayi]